MFVTALKNKNHSLVSELLNSKFFIKDAYSQNQESKNFTFLYKYHENLENYFHKTYRKITGFGHYMVTNLSDQVDKERLILADTLCYAVSYLNSPSIYYDRWFTNTFLYGKNGSINFFERMSSKKHFEKVKSIFDVTNDSELKEKLENNKENSKDRLRYG